MQAPSGDADCNWNCVLSVPLLCPFLSACATHCANLTHQCLVSINRMEAEERKLLFDQHRAKQREADISNGCKASHDHDGPAYAQPGHVSERGAQDQIAIELFRCTREQELCDAIREEHDRQKTKPPTRWEEKRGVVWKGQLLKAPTFSPPVPLNSPLSMSLSPPIVPSDAATAAAAAATVPHAPATIVKDFLALSETDDDETSDCEIRPPRTQRAASVNVDTDGFLAATPAKRAADRFEETKEAAGIQPQSRMPNSAAAVPFIPAPSASSLLVDDSGPCPMELGDRDEQPRQPRALSSDGPVEDTPGPTEAAEVKVPESSMSMPESYVSSYDQVLRHYSQAPCVRAWSQEQQQRFFQFATVVHDPNQRERLEQIKKDEAYAVYFENLSLVQAEIQQWMLQQQTFGKGESSAVALANELGEIGNGTDKHGAASPSGPVLAGAAAADPVYKAVHVKRRLARRTSESAGQCEQHTVNLAFSCSSSSLRCILIHSVCLPSCCIAGRSCCLERSLWCHSRSRPCHSPPLLSPVDTELQGRIPFERILRRARASRARARCVCSHRRRTCELPLCGFVDSGFSRARRVPVHSDREGSYVQASEAGADGEDGAGCVRRHHRATAVNNLRHSRR